MPAFVRSSSDEEADQQRTALGQQADIDVHADGHEEQRQQEPAKRPNVALDLGSILGLGDEQAGEKGPEGHGEPRALGEPADAQHEQQSDAGEELGVAAAGDGAEQRTEREPARGEDDQERHRGLEECRSRAPAEYPTPAGRGAGPV